MSNNYKNPKETTMQNEHAVSGCANVDPAHLSVGSQCVAVRLDPTLVIAFRQSCKERGDTMTGVVRNFVANYVAN